MEEEKGRMRREERGRRARRKKHHKLTHSLDIDRGTK
jgi:hypothetical protein